MKKEKFRSRILLPGQFIEPYPFEDDERQRIKIIVFNFPTASLTIRAIHKLGTKTTKSKEKKCNINVQSIVRNYHFKKALH